MPGLSRRHWLCGVMVRAVVVALGVLPALMGGTGYASDTPRRPNIVFILADDLGYGDMGCSGQRRVRTSCLDRMAAGGMRFTQCHAGSTGSAPSRCARMRGLH